MQDRTEDDTEGWGERWSIWLISGALLLIAGLLYLVTPLLRSAEDAAGHWSMPPNAWGDLLAGTFGTAAFFVLALGYRLQRKELRMQRREMREQQLQTRRLADEAATQGAILRQQAERAELNGRMSEWALVQQELRHVASLALRQNGQHCVAHTHSRLRRAA